MDQVAYILSAIVAIVVGFHAVLTAVLQVDWSIVAWNVVAWNVVCFRVDVNGHHFLKGFCAGWARVGITQFCLYSMFVPIQSMACHSAAMEHSYEHFESHLPGNGLYCISWGIVSFWQHIPIALCVLFGLRIHMNVFFLCGFWFVIPHVSWGIVSFWQHIPIALCVLFGLRIHTSVLFLFFCLWFHTANAGLFFSIQVCREHQLSTVKQFVVICWDLERCTYWYSDWSIQMDKLPFGLVLFQPRFLDQSYSGVCVFIVSACGLCKTKFSKNIFLAVQDSVKKRFVWSVTQQWPSRMTQIVWILQTRQSVQHCDDKSWHGASELMCTKAPLR